jgi:hypothetical protein
MPLTAAEFAPGAIAYFDATVLNADPAVSKSGSPVDRLGVGNQFVCYKVDSQTSYWAPLTATYRRERLPIEAGWVTSGYGPLAAGGVYLQDGQCTYAGPIASFVQAAAQENPFQHGRPTLSEAGLAQVLRVVAERGGQL